MATTSALKRVSKTEQTSTQVDSATAQKVATSWMKIMQCEDALCTMDTGIFAWRAVPAVQTVMAACVADLINPTDKIMTLGLQAYPWMRAANVEVTEVLQIQLGKMLPKNIYAATADDIAANLKSGEVAIVAIHATSQQDWQDVRTITTAAVKNETPMLMVISAASAAPKGVIIETIENWNDAVTELRTAMQSVRTQKAIRVMAVADLDMPTMERTMMEAANVTPMAWADAMQKNTDGAELAVNAAYQAPVRTF